MLKTDKPVSWSSLPSQTQCPCMGACMHMRKHKGLRGWSFSSFSSSFITKMISSPTIWILKHVYKATTSRSVQVFICLISQEFCVGEELQLSREAVRKESRDSTGMKGWAASPLLYSGQSLSFFLFSTKTTVRDCNHASDSFTLPWNTVVLWAKC